ncbi:MAG: flagellar basal body rod protein FlgB [Proteobacteria bacterium]|nr:flagellar basal body rod protein FlgB [Pseudomonadota bacterium]MBU1584663.1 flagellar basal body rod protein FlgB [Pseudomonadota bacterium]MBU2451952.1 flagellar basal body rod protein FlgB [Pseudomonadota bacterium]MBU2631531.1 flagellar basal body rod protein FlgB [Pseudomonadota bacterium]
MTDSRIFGHTFKTIEKALDVSAKRHNLIAGNIANMDTIGYKPKDLDFNRTLKRAMGEKEPDFLDRTHDKHLSTYGDEDAFDMKGENSESVDIYHLDSVNIDTEMMNLTENNIKYRATTELLLRKLKILQYSIDEGGK